MRSFARRYWFVPAGLAVSAAVATSFGSTRAWVVMTLYTTLNLIGTLILVAPDWDARGDRPGCLVRWSIRGEDRTADVYGLVYVLQLPLGALVVIGLSLLAIIGGI